MTNTAVLLGSKPDSVVALLALINQGWTVTEVVASLEQATWLPKPSLFDVAKALGIRTVSDQSKLQSTGVDLVISYMSRSFVKESALLRGRYALNFHAGPLPEFGGWAFYNFAILKDSHEYGCTCHIMDQNFDTGPLVKVRRFAIDPSQETALSLEKKARTEMILLFREVISAYETNSEIISERQTSECMRYINAEQFAKLKEIPTNCSQEEADKIARGFWYPPYEMAYYRLANGTKLEVIPKIAKTSVARDLHRKDLEDLLLVCGITNSLANIR